MNISKFPLPAKRVATIDEWLAIKDFCDDNRVQDSPDILVTDSLATGKALLLANQGGGAGSAAGQSPWAIIPGDDPGTVKVGPNSSLMEDFVSEQTVTDIADSFTMVEDDFLYLEIDLSAGFTVDAVTLKAGVAWSGYPSIFGTTGAGTLLDPFVVNKGYFLIGYCVAADTAPAGLPGVTITDADDNRLKVIRCVYDPLMFAIVNPSGGFLMAYPMPFRRPGPPP